MKNCHFIREYLLPEWKKTVLNFIAVQVINCNSLQFFFCSAYIIIVLYLYGMKIKNVISLMSIDLQTFFRVSFFLLLLYSYGYLGFRVLSEKKESIKALLLINSSLHTLFESPEISTGQNRSLVFFICGAKKLQNIMEKELKSCTGVLLRAYLIKHGHAGF